jgi:hypothetical protein
MKGPKVPDASDIDPLLGVLYNPITFAKSGSPPPTAGREEKNDAGLTALL